MTEPRDPFDDLMRRALTHEADKVQPSDDGLYEIRRRLADESRPVLSPRKPWLLTAGAAVLGTAAAVGAFAVLTNDQPDPGPGVSGQESAPTPPEGRTQPTTAPTSPAPTSPAPTSPAPTSPTDDPTVTTKPTSKAVPVYWLGTVVGRPDLGPRLYRTFTTVTGNPGLEALKVLASGESGDPDYTSAWRGAQPTAVRHENGIITVDLAQLPSQSLGSEAAVSAVQELIYTVQGALGSTDPVRITLNGGPAGNLFGHVDTSGPIRRSAPEDVQAQVWITAPANGATVRSPVTVTGIAAVFEANVNWRVTNASGGVVQEGYTMTSEAFKFKPYTFSIDLAPGQYVIEAFEASPQDGRPTFTDSKEITVR
jgi:hypothetical protein